MLCFDVVITSPAIGPDGTHLPHLALINLIEIRHPFGFHYRKHNLDIISGGLERRYQENLILNLFGFAIPSLVPGKTI